MTRAIIRVNARLHGRARARHAGKSFSSLIASRLFVRYYIHPNMRTCEYFLYFQKENRIFARPVPSLSRKTKEREEEKKMLVDAADDPAMTMQPRNNARRARSTTMISAILLAINFQRFMRTVYVCAHYGRAHVQRRISSDRYDKVEAALCTPGYVLTQDFHTTIIIHQKSLHCIASCAHNVIIHLDIPTLKEKTAAATAKRVQFLRCSTRGYKSDLVEANFKLHQFDVIVAESRHYGLSIRKL
ncbi:unnamed protein product [Trichogramma brassicae]|uniref:Uncharacterized protein n=1 Tax=Trichogramma brassicae TaxID=86971 RepID=A0A6H5IEV5_9HYME|nr:unnamed protein product [Trichogramma brassicae]